MCSVSKSARFRTSITRTLYSARKVAISLGWAELDFGSGVLDAEGAGDRTGPDAGAGRGEATALVGDAGRLMKLLTLGVRGVLEGRFGGTTVG